MTKKLDIQTWYCRSTNTANNNHALYLRPKTRKGVSPHLRLGRIGYNGFIVGLVQTDLDANMLIIGYGKGGYTISLVAAKKKRRMITQVRDVMDGTRGRICKPRNRNLHDSQHAQHLSLFQRPDGISKSRISDSRRREIQTGDGLWNLIFTSQIESHQRRQSRT